MGLEVVQFISDLNVAWPTPEDKVREGDDHIRNIKVALLNTFPNIAGQVTLTHEELNAWLTYRDAFVEHLFPTGGIIAWSGAVGDIPDGWALCNGAGDTPDLRNRFIVGAGDDYAVDATGGAAEVTSSEVELTGATDGFALEASHMPAHRHFVANTDTSDTTLSAANYVAREKTSGGDSGYRLIGSATDASVGLTSSTGGGAEHGHDIDLGGHDHTVATLPPYYALCWIMKTLTWDL